MQPAVSRVASQQNFPTGYFWASITVLYGTPINISPSKNFDTSEIIFKIFHSQIPTDFKLCLVDFILLVDHEYHTYYTEMIAELK